MISFLMLNELMVFRHISGFSNAVRIDTSEEWIDRIRIWYSLVLKSKEMDQFFPVTATDVLFDKEGWRW